MHIKRKLTPLALGIAGLLAGILLATAVGLSFSGDGIETKNTASVKEAISLQDAFVSVSDRIGPAVVNISTEQILKYRTGGFGYEDFFNRFFGDEDFGFARPREKQYKRTGLGTGIIISGDGFILTNYHVIKDVTKITVILSDKSSYEGKVTGTSKNHDLAVVKINSGKKLPFALLGDSSKVKVGQWAIAIGNPFGYDHTVTAGIVSAIGRLFEDVDEEGLKRLPNLIQTDAAINPGNSGGPLCNIMGEVIGINVAIVSTSGSYAGIGFAIPVNEARVLLPDMMKGGSSSATAPWMGVRLQDLDERLKKRFKAEAGVVVNSVEDKSPANGAGLKPGDIITEVEGRNVVKPEDFQAELKLKKAGETLKFRILRDGIGKYLEVKLGDAAKAAVEAAGAFSDSLGINAGSITPQLVSKYRLLVSQGVVITEVSAGSEAASLGLAEGDIILELDKNKIKTMEDYNKAVSGMNKDEGILILIKRGRVTLYTVIKR
ncbi:MAG: Do family serine endopeptidase [Candidatus Firestonebacteria bacterium]